MTLEIDEKKIFVNESKIDFATASNTYLGLRKLYPTPKRIPTPQKINSLYDLVELFDVFICDGYGVLNFGAQPVPFTPEFIARIQQMGKIIYVLTNGSSLDSRFSVAKYAKLGYKFSAQQVVSSRDVMIHHLQKEPSDLLYGVAATNLSEIELLGVNALRLTLEKETFEKPDKFIFLSSGQWNEELQNMLEQALLDKPRPLIIPNPDVCAPFESWYSTEPSYYSYQILKKCGVVPTYYGKPFGQTYEFLLDKIKKETGLTDTNRMLMIGDTPFTDILGGNNAGVKTLLLKDFGFLKDTNAESYFKKCGISPDYYYSEAKQ